MSACFLCLWVPAGGHRPPLHNETGPVELPPGRFYILSGERKPPFERRCPSAHTGAEDCISRSEMYEIIKVSEALFTSYVLLRKTQSSVSPAADSSFPKEPFWCKPVSFPYWSTSNRTQSPFSAALCQKGRESDKYSQVYPKSSSSIGYSYSSGSMEK